jgi:hypothetical protein
MAFDQATRDGVVLQRLLQRARIVVRHHRHRCQPVDVRRVVQLVLAGQTAHPAEVGRYRALLEEAVGALVHGFR